MWKNPFKKSISTPVESSVQGDGAAEETKEGPLTNPYDQLARSSSAYESDPFNFDTSPLKNAGQKLAASATKTKTDFLKLLDKADSQISKFVTEQNNVAARDTGSTTQAQKNRRTVHNVFPITSMQDIIGQTRVTS